MNLEHYLRDLELRFDAEQRLALEAETREAARAEYSRISLQERLAPLLGERVLLCAADGQHYHGQLAALGNGWLQVLGESYSAVVPAHSILWWESSEDVGRSDVRVGRYRMGFSVMLRAYSASRQVVTLSLYGTPGAQVAEMSGYIARVGADFLELLPVQPAGAELYGSSRASRRSVRIIPLGGIAAIVSSSAL
ncbi:MAG: hypothetical protein Q4P78_02810 [Rothia sp. (in: high G+C Gram-positive bacteria)]|uniref:hypothetical protein n=1 Tax=Rothia sp. (in: high G+C Gram-positive bacteria) TaxID=1885016 RepID=UPI0026E07CB6|nr:hypothetical protein [Rothia sp. (in: high G+C Gram-positive bacteria)]MDO5750120.1 hypothetical protein [Rothia sp. (in: high G+C Gram-positive bacteria)]